MNLVQAQQAVERARDAYAAATSARAELGRPTVVTPEALAIIRAMRGSGSSYRQVAKALNDAGIPTAQGGREWYASTVRAIHQRSA